MKRYYRRGEAFAETVTAGTYAVLNFLWVPEEKRGGGIGTALMKEVCEDADAEGMSVTLLVASGNQEELPDEVLRDWYGRYGFVQDDRWQSPMRLIRRPMVKEKHGHTR